MTQYSKLLTGHKAVAEKRVTSDENVSNKVGSDYK